MAAPHVAGVAALLAAQGRDDDQILSVLLRTSRQPTGTRGVFTPSYGWGIVDAAAAVAVPVTSTGGSTEPSPKPRKSPKGKGQG
jgi:subtilisin family serine protease